MEVIALSFKARDGGIPGGTRDQSGGGLFQKEERGDIKMMDGDRFSER